MGALEETLRTFEVTPYLRVGQPGARRSSWLSGTEGALVFFYEATSGHVYLVATQAPWIVEQIQRQFGASVDGKFGDQTRRAIVAQMQRDYPDFGFQPGTAAIHDVTGYALAKTLFRGAGRVGFPNLVEWPNITTATRANGRATTLRIIDTMDGRAVSLSELLAREGAAPPAPAPPAPAPPAPAPPVPPLVRPVVARDPAMTRLFEEMLFAYPNLTDAPIRDRGLKVAGAGVFLGSTIALVVGVASYRERGPHSSR